MHRGSAAVHCFLTFSMVIWSSKNMKTIRLLIVGMSALLASCATYQIKTKPSCCTTPARRQITEGELFSTSEILIVNGIKATYDQHLDAGRLVFARCHGKILVTLPCHDDLLPEKLPLSEFGGMSIEEARHTKAFLLSWFSVTEERVTVRKTLVHPIRRA